jgi:aminoglycoside phosphotransferase (APT) family kinase protein
MGRALAQIHDCRPPRGLPKTQRRVEPFLSNKDMRRTIGDVHPAGTRIWTALTAAGVEPLRRKNVLLHGDYHAGNVLWLRGSLRGIVDWETAQAGPRGRDLGYTRMDCTITGGPQMADAMTDGYGGTADDLWFWELLAAVQASFAYRDWAPAWRHYGLTGLTVRTVRRRLDAFIERVLAEAP